MSENDYRHVPLGRPPEEDVEPLSEESRLATLRVWVEPTLFEPYEGERRALLDRARPHMAAAGLLVHDQWVSADPSEVRLYRRFTNQRVTLDQVLDLISQGSGISLSVIVKRLYHETPWTDARERSAVARARQAIHRLQHSGRIVRRRDGKGTARFYAAEVAPRSISTSAPAQLDPSSSADLRAAGWRLLHHADREDGTVSFVFVGEAGVVEAVGTTDVEALNFIREELAGRVE